MASEGSEVKTYSTDPALYIYTSLTAGSSHIVTATSRLETILRANRVPFKAIDIATDEKARMLWGRRAGKDASGRVRKLPGLVQMGMILGVSSPVTIHIPSGWFANLPPKDLVEIEEWNEYGELKQNVTIYYDDFTQPPISQAPKPPAAKEKPICNKPQQPSTTASPITVTAPAPPPRTTLPIRSIAEEAAAKAKQVHLQNLRDKVHGKGSSAASTTTTTTTTSSPPPATETKETKQTPTSTSTAPTIVTKSKETEAKQPPPSPASAGLQSPTSSGWKSAGAAISSKTTLLQSPTTTSWKPTDVDAPVTKLHGSVVASASAEEIAAVERAETIKEEEGSEEEEEESEEEESEEDSESEEEDSEEEEEVKVKGKVAGK